MLHMDMNTQNLPIEVVEEKVIKNNLKYNLTFSKAGILAGIIKIPPKEERTLLYTELPRTLEDEKKIKDLISTIGSNGYWDLMCQEKRVRKLGDDLRYLHPLKFIGYIFTHTDDNGIDLKKHMSSIFDDYFKRTNFINDFTNTMNIYDLKNKLSIYLQDFSNEVNIDINKINRFFDKSSKDYGDWESFVKVLINN